MANGKLTKREFVEAYQWLYGASKKEAEYIYNISTYDYKILIIESYVNLIAEKSLYID